jgi:thiol-disulfide isomerase/thioredoxin
VIGRTSPPRGGPPAAIVGPAVALLFALACAGETGAGPIVAKRAKSKPPPVSSGLKPAPAIDLKRWINTKPLRPADLEGKVRLVEFWTFGCVNCQNTVMAMREIHGLYAKKGLLVLGIHTPEFPKERDSVAVAAAVREQGIGFPVALDNDYATFRAFKNRYWPALYLLDRKGIVRATHVGELHVGTRAWSNFCAAIEQQLAGKEPPRGS